MEFRWLVCVIMVGALGEYWWSLGKHKRWTVFTSVVGVCYYGRGIGRVLVVPGKTQEMDSVYSK